MDLTSLLTPESLIALVTLIALELVLGVDNIIFISILAGKLPEADRSRARTVGIAMAVVMRIALLFSLAWIISLDEPLFHVLGVGISGHSLILIVGGLFLIGKSTIEIHEKLEGQEGHASAKVASNFTSVIIQIMLLDIVFSLDSVITAVGMVDEIPIMVIAVLVAAGVMIFTSTPIGEFVERHPAIKMLALSFLVLIGFNLVTEGLGYHIPKGYTYFAMGFAVLVEMLNLRLRQSHTAPVNLREAYTEDVVMVGNSLPLTPGSKGLAKKTAQSASRKVIAKPAKPAKKKVNKKK